MRPLLVESLPSNVQIAALAMGVVKNIKSRVPRNLAKLLTIPLFDLPEPFVNKTAIVIDEMEPIAEAVDFADVDAGAVKKEPWTEDGILKLHSVLLEESLRALAGRGNAAQKVEILEWVFAPELVGQGIRNGREVPVFASQVPWTFTFCCRLEGMDADRIRNKIIEHMPLETRKFFF